MNSIATTGCKGVATLRRGTLMAVFVSLLYALVVAVTVDPLALWSDPPTHTRGIAAAAVVSAGGHEHVAHPATKSPSAQKKASRQRPSSALTGNEVLTALPPGNTDMKAFNQHFMKTMKTLKKVLLAKRKLDDVLAGGKSAAKKGRRHGGASSTPLPYGLNNTNSLHGEPTMARRRRIGKRMLDELEGGIFEKATTLAKLAANLTDVAMREWLETRLLDLQEKSILAKEDLSELVSIEKQEHSNIDKAKKADNTTGAMHIGGLVDEIEGELGKAISEMKADLSIGGGAWGRARGQEHSVETVLKVVYDSATTALIDHENNIYTLSFPFDASVHHEDKEFTKDVALILVGSFVGSVICAVLRLPHFFGFIGAGCLLGPSVLNRVHNVVQLESLASYGVCFMLFLLGVEFTFDKISKVLRPAAIGGIVMTLVVTVVATVVLHGVFHAPVAEGAVLGFCFSLSSTAVAMKCVHAADVEASDLPNGRPSCVSPCARRVLIGILVMQDVSLGLMVALIPNLTTLFDNASSLVVVAKLVAALLGMAAACVLIGHYVIKSVYPLMKEQNEMFLLFVLTCLIVGMQVGEALGLGVEVGGFLSGLAFAGCEDVQHAVMESMKPLQDFFVCFFFGAIGFHVFPTFLVREMMLLLSITLLVVCSKYVVGLLLLHYTCGMDIFDASIVSLGLSQMSEFSFIIASHGKAQGILSNEMYFLLLGTVAMSLPTTPLLWRLHDKQTRHSET